MASKRSKVAPRTEPEEPDEGAEDEARADGADEADEEAAGADEADADADEADADGQPVEGEGETGSARRATDEEVHLAPPPMRLFALFLIPLIALLVWALFFK
jgi:hypothetical protein